MIAVFLIAGPFLTGLSIIYILCRNPCAIWLSLKPPLIHAFEPRPILSALNHIQSIYNRLAAFGRPEFV